MAVATPSAPPTSGLTEAKALVRAGKPEEPLTLLRPLVRGRTVDAGVLFHIGVAAIGASRKPGLSDDARGALLDEAMAALRTLLIGRQDLVRVRLELARAFFRKGEDSLARRHFEQVLVFSISPSLPGCLAFALAVVLVDHILHVEPAGAGESRVSFSTSLRRR